MFVDAQRARLKRRVECRPRVRFRTDRRESGAALSATPTDGLARAALKQGQGTSRGNWPRGRST